MVINWILLLCLLALLAALVHLIGVALFYNVTRREALSHLKSRFFQHYHESRLWITLFLIGPYFLWVWATINLYEQSDIPGSMQLVGGAALLLHIVLSLTVFPVWKILRGNPMRRAGHHQRTLRRLNR